MPKFNQFMEGFEEKPEVNEEAKPEEVKTEKPKVEESEFSKSRPAFTHNFAESLRKDAINWANEKLPYPYNKSLPKILNNYTQDEVIDFMRGNIGEDEIMKRAKERNGINQDRVNLLAKQEATKPEIKPQPRPGSFQSMEKSFDKPLSNDKKKVWELWQDNLKHLNSEDIELSNEKAENFYNEFAKHLTPEQENEFATIFATYKDPQEVEDYIAKVIGSKPEEPKPQSRSFYDVEVGDMWVLPNDMKLKVKERQGRNVLVDYGRGREEWYDIDDFVNIRGFDQSFKYPHELEEE